MVLLSVAIGVPFIVASGKVICLWKLLFLGMLLFLFQTIYLIKDSNKYEIETFWGVQYCLFMCKINDFEDANILED